MKAFLDHITQIATSNNVDASNPFMMQFDQRYWIVVSPVEPTMVMPLNVVWVKNEIGSELCIPRRRTSKDPSEGFLNTWLTISDLEELKQTQVWDNADLPTGVFSQVHANSGQVSFPIVLRQSDSYDVEEAIPKQEITSIITSKLNNFYRMYSAMNGRVIWNKNEILKLKDSLPDEEFYRLISDLMNQVTQNTDDIKSLGTSDFKSMTFDIVDTEVFSTTVKGQVNIVYSKVRKDSGETILPQEVLCLYDKKTDTTELVFMFAYKLSGKISTIG